MNTQESDDEHEKIVATDPTQRFEKYATSLGKGAHKEVFKAFDRENGVEVAWNELKPQGRDVGRLLDEIHILERLRNDNVINLYHSWKAKDSSGVDTVIFITELMTSGTLKAYLKKTKGAIKPKVLRGWIRQILQGLNYLHTTTKIIHRDLKCDNIFVNGSNGILKIGDLGLAAPKNGDKMSSLLGTPEFMAPELYDEDYDEKVDIYSFGMVVLEIVTGDYPYKECQNQAQIFKKVVSGIKPASLEKIKDKGTRDFVELCIQFEKSKRPSASELLSHPFLEVPPNEKSDSVNTLTTPMGSPKVSLTNTAVELSRNDSIQLTASASKPIPFSSPVLHSTVIDRALRDEPDLLLPEPIAPIPKKSSKTSKRITIQVTSRAETEINLRMIYTTPDKSRSNEIKFTFNILTDTTGDVIAELIAENLIDSSDEGVSLSTLEDTINAVTASFSDKDIESESEMHKADQEPQYLELSMDSSAPLEENFSAINLGESSHHTQAEFPVTLHIQPTLIDNGSFVATENIPSFRERVSASELQCESGAPNTSNPENSSFGDLTPLPNIKVMENFTFRDMSNDGSKSEIDFKEEEGKRPGLQQSLSQEMPLDCSLLQQSPKLRKISIKD